MRLFIAFGSNSNDKEVIKKQFQHLASDVVDEFIDIIEDGCGGGTSYVAPADTPFEYEITVDQKKVDGNISLYSDVEWIPVTVRIPEMIEDEATSLLYRSREVLAKDHIGIVRVAFVSYYGSDTKWKLAGRDFYTWDGVVAWKEIPY